nr:heparinase II/III family protein [Bartonella sp. HY038]
MTGDPAVTSMLADNLDFKTSTASIAVQRWARRLSVGPFFRWRFSGFSPQQILNRPIDLHLADPYLAHEFYHGRFPLAGRIVQTGSISPFVVVPPTREWQNALHDFSWLRHMAAAETELANAHARSLLGDWIDICGKRIHGNVWDGAVTAGRIISWLTHSDILYESGNTAFKKRFLRSLGLQVRYLRTAVKTMDLNEHRLLAHIALTFAALALPVSQRVAKRTTRNLERELQKQILPDGGHISRNPAILLMLLSHLIALRHCFAQSDIEVPEVLHAAVERMLPALRFFQHRDQSLGNFNGVGPTLSDRLDIILQSDETAGNPFSHAPHSGYQRLAAGGTTVLADTGKAPSGAISKTANAGCLSFEMSSGIKKFVVNCGVDPYGPEEFRFSGRLTAAHSTATINDTSSCRFRKNGRVDSAITAGPSKVVVKRLEQDGQSGFIALHDGYARSFNVLHQRTMMLSDDGMVLEGADSFLKANKAHPFKTAKNIATIRFHLHPDVEVSRSESGALRLEVMGADSWSFQTDAPLHLEDSIYFCGLKGPTKTRQIVISCDIANANEVYWAFQRLSPIAKSQSNLSLDFAVDDI